ncbi:glycosyltransferase family 4 protein [Leucobacter tardus]|uniref:Glycosyltransferase n=1 Tax=Leucobacter tardus TaxID=501483 RepID=A0A939TM42_9MICO|nr:glycosyltransferase [Leucobacter tardus]MBO2988784.1 glycosyltransferase [Leucobacter tardus]
MRPPPRHGASTVLIANPSADLYGSDRMVLEAARALIRAGSRVVVTCSVDGPLTGEMRGAGAEVRVLSTPVIRKRMLRPLGLLGLVRRIVVDLPRMRRLIADVRPRFVLANTLTIPFWTLAARMSRVPVIVYVHEAEASLSRVARALLLAPLRRANGVIYNSETSRLASSAPSLERRHRVATVVNGVANPGPATPPRPAITGALRVVYVGRLSPRKGVDLVIAAARLVHESGIDIEVELVGDVFPGYEWYAEDLARRAEESGLGERIRFAGFQPSVWPALAAADVVVVPSRADESFGNVVIEAALSGRPVIVADHTGLHEASAGLASAIRVPNDDARAIATALTGVREHWKASRAAALATAEFARRWYDPVEFRGRFVEAAERLGRED